jgi:excinuclease ABC subunit B
VQESLRVLLEGEGDESARVHEGPVDVESLIRELETEMKDASRKLEYERAALLRDQIMELKGGATVPGSKAALKAKPMKGKRGWKK